MIEVGYYNGKIGPLQEMEIPMLDRACYFGDGVYDFSLCIQKHQQLHEESFSFHP